MTVQEEKLKAYLRKMSPRHELFLMGKDAVILVSVKTYVHKKRQIQSDVWNYFGLTPHLNELGRSYKTTILNVASKYFTMGKITQAHFEAIFEEYDRYFAQDYTYYHDDV